MQTGSTRIISGATTPDEADAIDRAAELAGLTRSAWVRRTCAAAALEELEGGDPAAAAAAVRAELNRLEAERERLEARIAGLEAATGDGGGDDDS